MSKTFSELELEEQNNVLIAMKAEFEQVAPKILRGKLIEFLQNGKRKYKIASSTEKQEKAKNRRDRQYQRLKVCLISLLELL